MEIAVSGRHVELGERLRAQATSKVEHLAKYLGSIDRAEVVFSDQRKGPLAEPLSCEVVLVAPGRVVRTEGHGHEMKAALEAACEKAAHRLVKENERRVDRSRPRHKAPKRPPAGPPGDSSEGR